MKRVFVIILAMALMASPAAFARGHVRSVHTVQLSSLIQYPFAFIAALNGNPVPLGVLIANGTGNEQDGPNNQMDDGAQNNVDDGAQNNTDDGAKNNTDDGNKGESGTSGDGNH